MGKDVVVLNSYEAIHEATVLRGNDFYGRPNSIVFDVSQFFQVVVINYGSNMFISVIKTVYISSMYLYLGASTGVCSTRKALLSFKPKNS